MQNQDEGDTQKKPKSESEQKENQRNQSDFSEESQARQEGLEGDALAWLEGPAFNSPIEEMPTLAWPEINGDPEAEMANPTAQIGGVRSNESDEPADNLEDAMNWLEELAAGQGTPIDEMPTLISGGKYDEMGPEEIENNANSVEITGKTSTLADHDSDPMAWLEQLAVDQSSPLEELPSVADRLLASEIESQNEDNLPVKSKAASQPISLEVEEAIFYLEQIAAKDGIDLKQVDIEQLQIGGSAGKSLSYIDQLAEDSPHLTPASDEIKETAGTFEEEKDWEDLSSQIPEDPDEALEWLGGLAEEEPGEDVVGEPEEDTKETEAVQSEPVQSESATKVQEIEVQADDIQTFDDMPDDPDEAMAWMQRLAEQEDDAKGHKPEKEAAPAQKEPSAENYKKSSLDTELLAHARQALNAGDLDKATEYYQDILESGTGGSQIIKELEMAVEKEPGSSDLFRLLGDAYMQDGQMQKALKTYRKGFDHL